VIGWIRPTDAESSVGGLDASARKAAPEVFFLRRLYRLVELSARPDLDPVQRRQVNHALYSTYWDCAGLGMQSKVTTILGLPPQRRQIAAHVSASCVEP
jgi:hypothetical protein